MSKVKQSEEDNFSAVLFPHPLLISEKVQNCFGDPETPRKLAWPLKTSKTTVRGKRAVGKLSLYLHFVSLWTQQADFSAYKTARFWLV
jgi:hypothetical protein